MTRPDTAFTGPELCARPARDGVADLRRGDLSPAEVLAASAQRMDQVEADVNAMPTRCIARAQAAIADLPGYAAQNAGHAAWLAGLPIAIKDLMPVAFVTADMAGALDSPLYGMFDLFSSPGRDWSFIVRGEAGEQRMLPYIVARDREGFKAANGIGVLPDHGFADAAEGDER